MQVDALQKGKYIIAVSGGVDSMALLHFLAGEGESELIVAHVDHGIREDSSEDKGLVERAAQQYSLAFESLSANLGHDTSEQRARRERYEFLRSMQAKHAAAGIITAHHADDVVETMIINLARGSGWRGLCSLRSSHELIRPLLQVSKKDIIAYAQRHEIFWREDSTNQDPRYLRNFVRREVMPGIDTAQWLKLYEAQMILLEQIETELLKHSPTLSRHNYIMWPSEVALEVLRDQLILTRPQAKRVLMAIKTTKNGKRLAIGCQELTFTPDEFVIK